MRVGIIGLLHESNTFIATPTTIESFRHGVLASGEEVREKFAKSHHEIGGFFGQLEAEGVEAVPIFAARATPSGVITAAAVKELLERMEAAFRRAGKLDGLLLAPHGAGVSEPYPDLDGHWLSLVRSWVGREVPIVSTIDPHANLSDAMVNATDALIAYRTNPHLDQRERGVEAARLIVRTLRGEVKPTQAAVMPPIAINIERQAPSQPPCLPLYQRADAMLGEEKVLSNSIVLGFPYADVTEMGSACIVVTNNDAALAQKHASALAGYLIEHHDDFVGKFISIESAIATARTSPQPVLLLDMGDNVGGGSPGDGTLLAHALHDAKLKSFVAIYDPESAAACERAGVGADLALHIGGRHDPSLGPPFGVLDVSPERSSGAAIPQSLGQDAQATKMPSFCIRSLHDGTFTEPQPRHGGLTNYDMGRTAIVETESGLTLMLTSRRVMPSSLHQLTHCGVDPATFQVIVAKGVHAPIAAYAPVCKTIIRVNTPGPTTADMLQLNFHHRRRPLFPFEGI